MDDTGLLPLPDWGEKSETAPLVTPALPDWLHRALIRRAAAYGIATDELVEICFGVGVKYLDPKDVTIEEDDDAVHAISPDMWLSFARPDADRLSDRNIAAGLAVAVGLQHIHKYAVGGPRRGLLDAVH